MWAGCCSSTSVTIKTRNNSLIFVFATGWNLPIAVMETNRWYQTPGPFLVCLASWDKLELRARDHWHPFGGLYIYFKISLSKRHWTQHGLVTTTEHVSLCCYYSYYHSLWNLKCPVLTLNTGPSISSVPFAHILVKQTNHRAWGNFKTNVDEWNNALLIVLTQLPAPY